MAVLADQERPVICDGDADWTTPDSAVADDEAGQEILVFTGRLPILDEDADHRRVDGRKVVMKWRGIFHNYARLQDWRTRSRIGARAPGDTGVGDPGDPPGRLSVGSATFCEPSRFCARSTIT